MRIWCRGVVGVQCLIQDRGVHGAHEHGQSELAAQVDEDLYKETIRSTHTQYIHIHI